jgi:hypothetical protein
MPAGRFAVMELKCRLARPDVETSWMKSAGGGLQRRSSG